jgi:transcriptional regulator with XRE-family HTH domain
MSDNQSRVEVVVQHYAGILRQAVRAAGFSVTEVERRLSIGPKALRRVLCGTVDLKLKHVIAVLRVIGMSEEEFFSVAVRTAAHRREQPSPGGELLATFERLGYGKSSTAGDDPEVSDEQFDRLVEEVVNRVMQRQARQQGAPLHAAEPLAQSEGQGERDPGGDGEAL